MEQEGTLELSVDSRSVDLTTTWQRLHIPTSTGKLPGVFFLQTQLTSSRRGSKPRTPETSDVQHNSVYQGTTKVPHEPFGRWDCYCLYVSC
jgi:hypothetical protein